MRFSPRHSVSFGAAGTLLLSALLATCGGETAPASSPAAAAASKPAVSVSASAKPGSSTAAPAKAAASGAAFVADPQLLDAAKKEAELNWYTSMQPPELDENLGKQFQAATGIKVNVTRIGSERLFQRYMQEQGSNVKIADVLHTSDEANFVDLKNRKLLLPYQVKSAAAFAAGDRDADNMYATLRESLYTISYNTKQVTADQLPKKWADLTDPKWKGKIVIGNPSYSGGEVTGIQALSKTIGWEYFEGLGKNNVMVVQAVSDTSQTVGTGERAIAAGGSEYTVNDHKAHGEPIDNAYPEDGVVLLRSPVGIVANAPHPNAPKLFMDFLLSPEVQQRLVTDGGLYVPLPSAKLRSSQKPLDQVKLLVADPVETLAQTETIRKRFTQIFGV